MSTRPTAAGRPLLVVTTLGCLLLALATGLIVAVKSVSPELALQTLPLQILRPLHTLASMGCVFTGICALFLFAGREAGSLGMNGLASIVTFLVLVFLPAAALSIVLGEGSGKEYVSWAPVLTPLLVAVFALLAVNFFTNLRAFVSASPEAAWLIGLGLLCISLGLIETSAYRMVGADFARELSFDWHALDIVFAGWSAMLYGFGILMVGHRIKPLRTTWLYALAAFTFVSTFGHHHYMSPQAHVIKIIALTASMMAGLSFVRHVRAVLKARGKRPAGAVAPFLRTVEIWTLVAIGSGILLAVPQVNLVLHGTYAVVAHSMGAMMGVDLMLVLGGLVFYLRPVEERAVARITRYLGWFNVALALFWVDLVAAGVVKGVMRFDDVHAVYQPIVLRVLTPLPVLGVLVAIPLVLISVELLRQLVGHRRGGEPGAEIRGVVLTPVRAVARTDAVTCPSD